MPSTVEADLRQLKLAMSIYRRMDNAIHQEDIYVELAERLREELDYRREASQMALYHAMLHDVADVHVPVALRELSSNRLLTMTWLEGGSMQAWLDTGPSQEARNRMARALFQAWYKPSTATRT